MIIEKSAYADQTVQEIETDLKRQGYSPLHISETPESHLAPHSHPQKHIIVIMEGAMELELNGESTDMLPGDKVTIPPHLRHAAYFGDEGCRYFWIKE